MEPVEECVADRTERAALKHFLSMGSGVSHPRHSFYAHKSFSSFCFDGCLCLRVNVSFWERRHLDTKSLGKVSGGVLQLAFSHCVGYDRLRAIRSVWNVKQIG